MSGSPRVGPALHFWLGGTWWMALVLLFAPDLAGPL